MTDKCEHEHECYRGHLNQGDTFSIVATGVKSTEPNSLYVLCNGGYYDNNSNLKQRLYFSRDPYDYIPNIRKDSLNNGYTVFSYKKQSNKIYNLEFRSKLIKNFIHSTKLNKKSELFKLNNLDTEDATSGIEEFLNLDFEPSKFLDLNLLYVGTEYKISSLTGIIKWYLKKDEADKTYSLREFTNANIYYPNTNFVESQSGIIDNTFTSITDNQGTSIFTITSPGLCNDINLLQNSGRFLITNANTAATFVYDYLTKPVEKTNGNGVSIHYVFNSKSVPYTVDANGGYIIFYNETSEDNYEEITNVDNIKFYLIPSETFSYFPDSRSLQNMIYNNTFQRDHNSNITNFIFKDYFDNNDDLRNKSIPFLVNKFINRKTPSLPNFFTKSTELFLPTTYLANTHQYNHDNDIHSIPYLIWTTKIDSIHSYFYPYCNKNEKCGICLGLTDNVKVKCHTHEDTYLAGLGAYEETNSLPMSSAEKPNTGNIVIAIVSIVIVLCCLGLFLHNRNIRK